MWAEITAGLKRVYNVIALYVSAGTDSRMKIDEEDIKDNAIIIVHVLRKMCVWDRNKGQWTDVLLFSLYHSAVIGVL